MSHNLAKFLLSCAKECAELVQFCLVAGLLELCQHGCHLAHHKVHIAKLLQVKRLSCLASVLHKCLFFRPIFDTHIFYALT